MGSGERHTAQCPVVFVPQGRRKARAGHSCALICCSPAVPMCANNYHPPPPHRCPGAARSGCPVRVPTSEGAHGGEGGTGPVGRLGAGGLRGERCQPCSRASHQELVCCALVHPAGRMHFLSPFPSLSHVHSLFSISRASSTCVGFLWCVATVIFRFPLLVSLGTLRSPPSFIIPVRFHHHFSSS